MGILKKLFPRKNEHNTDELDEDFNVEMDETDEQMESMDDFDSSDPPKKKIGFKLPIIRLPFARKKKEDMEFDLSGEEGDETNPDEESTDDSGKRKKKNPENEMSPRMKFAIMATCGILIGAGYVLKDNIRDYFNPPSSAGNTASHDKQSKGKKKEIPKIVYTAAVQTNPFVETKNLAETIGAKPDENKNAGKVTTMKALPTIPAITRTPPVASSAPVVTRTLPVIPAAPKPAVPAGAAMPSAGGSSTPQVQGVVTDDQGNSMAIMNDGTVVSTGETYKDGRIAYIGGDGITFDNGKKIGMATP